MDGDAVAVLVPVDDGLGKAGGHGKVAPVFMLEALLECGGDDGRAAEVGVGDAHACDDRVFAVAAELGVPLGTVCADAVVGSVEVEAFCGEQRQGSGSKEIAAADWHDPYH